MNNLDFKKIKCILFDFDGLIVDTEWVHYYAFNKLLKEYGIKISKQEYLNKYLAYDDKGCFKEVFQQKKGIRLTTKNLHNLVVKKTKILMAELKKGVKVYNDTLEFINWITQNYPEIKLGIVSGALKHEINFILKKLKLTKKFSLIISSEDVKNGKPSAEPFIKAKKIMEKMLNTKFDKKEILVIEDAINGILSAKKAGLPTLAVAHTYSVKELQKVNSDFVVKSLTEIIPL